MPETDIARAGEQAFGTNGCAGRHTVDGNPTAVGKVASEPLPLREPTTLGASILPNDYEHPKSWIEDPQAD